MRNRSHLCPVPTGDFLVVKSETGQSRIKKREHTGFLPVVDRLQHINRWIRCYLGSGADAERPFAVFQKAFDGQGKRYDNHLIEIRGPLSIVEIGNLSQRG